MPQWIEVRRADKRCSSVKSSNRFPDQPPQDGWDRVFLSDADATALAAAQARARNAGLPEDIRVTAGSAGTRTISVDEVEYQVDGAGRKTRTVREVQHEVPVLAGVEFDPAPDARPVVTVTADANAVNAGTPVLFTFRREATFQGPMVLVPESNVRSYRIRPLFVNGRAQWSWTPDRSDSLVWVSRTDYRVPETVRVDAFDV